jgi:hypothetical protein
MADTPMADVPPVTFGIDELRALLSQHLAEVKGAIREEVQNVPSRLQVVLANLGMPSSTQTSAGRSTGVSAHVFLESYSLILTTKQSFFWNKQTEQTRQTAPQPSNLELENSTLASHIQELQAQLQSQKEQADLRCATERSRLEEQLSQERQENRRLKDQVSKFRDIIINKGSGAGDVVSDAVVIQRFSELRQTIQKVVLKWYDVDINPILSRKDNKVQHRFFEQWNNKRLSSANLQNRSRGMIFDLLYEEILGRPFFCLEGVKYEDQGNKINLETPLARFENIMTKHFQGMSDLG